MLLVLSLLAAHCVALSVPSEPTLDCSCQMSGEMKFSAAHSKDQDGKWNTQIAVTRGNCNSTESHTDVIAVPFPEQELKEVPPTVSVADLGYEKFAGYGHYKLMLYGDTWAGAVRRCAADGAHLAIPNSDGETAIMRDLLFRHKILPGCKNNDMVWLGLHDSYNEGFFTTIFGEPVKATGWDQWDPRPDNAGWAGNHPGEDCVVFLRNTGKMTDVKCEETLAFFCEKEESQYPPPGSVDYSAGAYVNLDQERKPLTGKVRRRRPALGYELFPGVGFYKFHTPSATWDNARRVCREEGGHLAIINSASEHQVLLDLFNRYKGRLRHVTAAHLVYIGFNDIVSEGNYRTVHGDAITATGFLQWAAGEPSDNGVIIPGEDCGVLYSTGGLGDTTCISMLAFICEQDLFL